MYLDQASSGPSAVRPGAGPARAHGALACLLCARAVGDAPWANVYAGDALKTVGAVHESCWAAFLEHGCTRG